MLRLGLDGHLTLSVHFVNLVRGRFCRAVPREQAEVGRRSYRLGGNPDGSDQLISEKPGFFDVSKSEVLEYVEPQKTVSVDGIWDLSMLGNERWEVESRYQALMGRQLPEIPQIGVFVRKPNGIWLCLVERGSDPWEEWIEPATIGDADLVVRTTALDDLKARVSQSSTDNDKPSAMDKTLATRERGRLLIIIAALAKMAGVDLSKSTKAGDTIARQTELLGERVSSRSIQDHIKKIPEELRQGDDPAG